MAEQRFDDQLAQALGPPQAWSPSRRLMTELIMAASFPMFLVWGPERILIYNQAYSVILDGKHPRAQGRPFFEVWPEVREQIEPVIDAAFRGQASYFENLEVELVREGHSAPAWFTFSYSPVPGDGATPGVLCVCNETTASVAERQARIENEAQLAFFDRLATAIGPLIDADAVMTTTTRLVGEHLGVSICAYADMDDDGDGFTIRGDWCAPGSPSIVGHYRLAAFGSLAVKRLNAGLPLVINDNRVEIAPSEAATFQVIGITATICMPLIRNGKLTALMAVHHKSAHRWTDRELGFMREVTDRSWAFVERVASEAELRKSEEELRSITDAAPVLISYIDRDHVYRFVNSAYETWFGRPRKEILGRHLRDLLGEEAYQGVRPRLDAALRGERQSFERLMPYTDQPDRDVQVDYVARRDETGAVIGVYALISDVSPRVAAERAMLQSETRLRLATEFAGVGLWDVDEVAGTLFWDDRVRGMFGLTSSRPVTMDDFYRALHPADREATAAAYAAAADPQRRALYDVEYRTVGLEDGETRWVAAKGRGVFDADGRCLRVLGATIDITERKRLTQRLAEEVERVQLALDAGAIVGTWVWDVLEDRVTADERFAQAFGLDPVACREGIPIATAMASIHPEDAERVRETIETALSQGGGFRAQYRVLQGNAYRWIEANGRVDRDTRGAPLRFPGVLLDIDTRRQVEAERDRALEMLETFVQAMPGLVYAKDGEGRITVANRGLTDLLGRPREDVLGRRTSELDAPAWALAVMAEDQRLLDERVTGEVEEFVTAADGSVTYWHSVKSPVMAGDAIIGLVSTSIDITARKHAEDARDLLMREVDHRARNALAVIQSVVRLTDAANPERFREAIHGRIESMARAQAALARTQWRGGTIGEVVREELAVARQGRSLVLHGPEIGLIADHMQPLSMILHELVTNATKYGALSREDGRVEVAWEALDGGWRLRWTERGGPVVSPPSRRGFGSRLMAALARQLDAKLSVDWPPEGLNLVLEQRA